VSGLYSDSGVWTAKRYPTQGSVNRYLGFDGNRLDLLAQLIDHYAQVFDFIAVIRAPDGLQQLSMGDRPIRVIEEILEQVELFRR